MTTSVTVTVVVPNDTSFRRPFLKSSFFITHSSFQFSPLPLALNSQRPPYFRIFSNSTQVTTAPVTTTTTTTTSKRKPLAAYLIERLGFSEEDSLSISKRLLRRRDYPNAKQVTDLISYENADSVIAFLQQHCGLNHSHIQKLITQCPRVLVANVDKTLRPKIKLLQDLGFSHSDLAHCLSRNPRLYLDCDLTPAIQALRGILGNDEDVVKFCKRRTYGSSSKILSNLIPAVTMLENEYGIPRDKIRKFMTKTPQPLIIWRTERLREVLVRVEDKWGITRDSAQFLRALFIFCSFSDENVNSKCQVFRSYGWSDSDILSMIRTFPSCLTSSEARRKKSLEFYMNELRYDPAYLASRPSLLSYSLENRAVPRHKVLSILKEKGLIKADYQLTTALQYSEYKFFDRFIIPFKDVVPELSEVYVNSGESVKTVAAE